MGCDIHASAERKFDGSWDGYVFAAGIELDIDRWYTLFGYLAGVRGIEDPIVEPRGFPSKVSDEVKKDYESWDSDAHTPSWLTFKELKMLPKEFKKEPFYVYLESLAKLHGEDNVRLVFWFDN